MVHIISVFQHPVSQMVAFVSLLVISYDDFLILFTPTS